MTGVCVEWRKCATPFFVQASCFRRCIGINDLMINEEIRDREVRVVDQNGEQLGVMPIKQALEMAESSTACFFSPITK